SGESGKSTILKQFKLIHGRGFTDEERRAYRPAITGNLFLCALTLIDAMDQLGIQYEMGAEEAARCIDVLRATPSCYGEDEVVPQAAPEAIRRLWNDEGVQRCFERSNEFQLLDTCDYYMENIDRMCQNTYIPTTEDILRARVMTTTVTENIFQIEDMRFNIIDVGGQRSERKKWAPYFDDSQAIIFVSAISAYDQTCFEDNQTNRVIESMTLFENISSHPLFRNTAIILFFNKIDLFREKLQRGVMIKKYFPSFE
ncbi:guanine nucleotide-binding protein subunit alpha, partial [Quaeritorhiza haematococci]